MRIFRKSDATLVVALTVLLGGCAGNDIPVDAAPEDILTHAERKLADRKFLDAAEVLEFFIRSHPGTARVPFAKLKLGDARFGLEEYVLARGEYEDVVTDFPASEFVEEARYKIAQCAYASIYPHNRDQTETERAIELFEDFRRDYPGSRFSTEVDQAVSDCRDRLARAEFESGRFYEKQRRLRSAKIQYDYVVETYPKTQWAPRAALRLGHLYRHREKWEEASTWYQRVVSDYPNSAEAPVARQALTELPESQST